MNFSESAQDDGIRQNHNVFLLDYKRGDVTGDGTPDHVFLYGHKPDGDTGVFADDITVVIQDGRTGQTKSISPKFNAGYNAQLFLGDFDNERVPDIKVSIEAGGSGGYGIHYIYSFKNNILRELFDFERYNNSYKYRVDYNDFYKVSIGNIELNKMFILDISDKGYDFLSQYYRDDGTLIKPVQGEVLALGALSPIVTDERTPTYDLLAFQRIIGTTNADTFGFIENLLSWDGHKFATKFIVASTLGTNLTALLN